jgi:hypothetical protein
MLSSISSFEAVATHETVRIAAPAAVHTPTRRSTSSHGSSRSEVDPWPAAWYAQVW